MDIDKFGRVNVSEQEAFDSLYSGKISSFHNLFLCEQSVNRFNHSLDYNKDKIHKLKVLLDMEEEIEFFDQKNQCQWFMPKNYFPNLIDHLYSLAKSSKEKDRIDLELQLFIQHGMFDLLFYLKYLVDTMRENNIVWGVGRGSSVASFVLYLLGVHKIHSLDYELDIKEFLKEK